jgi:multiple sugar transport system permease protein
MSLNALITAGLFTWCDFLFARTLTTSPDGPPGGSGHYQYLGAYASNWNSVMAAAVLASVSVVALLMVARRFVAAGLSDGAGR